MRIPQDAYHPCAGQLLETPDGFACALVKSSGRSRMHIVHSVYYKPGCWLAVAMQ